MERMSNRNLISKNLLFLFFGILLTVSCTQDSNTIFDPDYQYEEEDPVIETVIPEQAAYAGIGAVTPQGIEPVIITGDKFGTNPDHIFVYFGQKRAEILELTNNTIKVTPPNEPSDSLAIRVVKLGAEKYVEYPPETLNYQLHSIFNPYPVFERSDTPRSITTGLNGELYATNFESDINRGIVRVDTEGEGAMVQVAEAADWTYPKMQHGPDGALYMVRGGAIGIIYRSVASSDDLSVTQLVRMARGFGGIQDVEFDKNDWLWATGQNNLLRVNIETGDNEQFPLDGDLRAIRIFNDHIYVAARGNPAQQQVSKIWRLRIKDDHTPDEAEIYLEMPNPDILIRDMVFTAAGDLVLAVNTEESVMVYRNGELEELYPGIVPPDARDFAVSNKDFTQLLVNIAEERVIILEMEQEMAPIYGTF